LSYAGIFVAPFLFVAALTGLAYTITPQLEQVVYHDELTVASTSGTPRPLAEQIAAAQAARPDGSLLTVRPGSGATWAPRSASRTRCFSRSSRSACSA
jgi:uncharacterized iron-regulated membrane protein